MPLRTAILGLAIGFLVLATACSSPAVSDHPTEERPAIEAPTATEEQPDHSSQETAMGEGSSQTEANPPAILVENLKSDLSTQTGIPADEIMFKSAETVEWSDSCLGAARPDEFCAQVITPGYRIVLATLTEEYVFHTDRSGETFRFVSE
ncbi:MAG: hypothetical protein HC865_06940 [Cyanobacteria bacterium RU_5_0]|nr:hypothetical protein [Cyanobacteria bacterium RU_5_0]